MTAFLLSLFLRKGLSTIHHRLYTLVTSMLIGIHCHNFYNITNGVYYVMICKISESRWLFCAFIIELLKVVDIISATQEH